MSLTPEQQKGFGQRKLKHPFLTALVIVACLVAIISFLVSFDNSDKKTEIQEEIATASTPSEKIEAMVHQVLEGNTSRGIARLRTVAVTPMSIENDSFMVRVEFNADENLSKSMIKSGIELRMAEVFHSLYGAGLPIQRLVINAHYPLVDQYGNEKDNTVYSTSLEGDVAKKINWNADKSTLEHQIIPGLWSVDFVSPAVK